MSQDDVQQKIKEREAQKIIHGHKDEKTSAKSGIIYVLLAYFACVIGLHNFYAGYYKRGIIQLILSLISPFMMFVPLLVVSLWGLGEMLFVNTDAKGVRFKGNPAIIWALRGIGIGFLIYSALTTELIL